MGHMGHGSSIQWVTWVMGHSKWPIAYPGVCVRWASSYDSMTNVTRHTHSWWVPRDWRVTLVTRSEVVNTSLREEANQPSISDVTTTWRTVVTQRPRTDHWTTKTLHIVEYNWRKTIDCPTHWTYWRRCQCNCQSVLHTGWLETVKPLFIAHNFTTHKLVAWFLSISIYSCKTVVKTQR